MPIRKAIVLIILICIPLLVLSQRTTRSGLKKAKVTETTLLNMDTIKVLNGEVRISGYEKTLRSTTESFFITNCLTDTVYAVHLTIDYQDNKGRQLHQRSETINIEIPPSQTRMAKLQSWDKQKVWHYRLSEVPRTRGQATPYDVKIISDWILVAAPQPAPHPSY